MTIREIRDRVKEMLAEAYKTAAEAVPVKDLAEIETNGFMRRQDAEALRDVCSKKNLFVSFRAAGPDTLQRIREGHPCKGHKITDKSIKPSGEGWTYLAPANPLLGGSEREVFEKLRGYVGCPFIPRTADGGVDYDAVDRPPRRVYRPDGTVDRAIFHLGGVYVLPTGLQPKTRSACEFAVLDAASLAAADLENAYTGDYDMHDLIGNGKRLMATTPEELSTIDALNHALLAKDGNRSKKVVLADKQRYHESPYALIRHGAQTTFFDFLTSDKGEAELKTKLEENLRAIGTEGYVSMLPYGDMVVKIDEHIVVFDNRNKAYLLNGIGQIYRFYVKNGLEDQIPFYNFFHALHAVPEYRDEIERFAAYINAIASVNCRLIDHTGNYPWRG